MNSKKYIRIIPKLDIKGPNLVKGIHLEGLRVLGKPEDFAFDYYKAGADELIYIDLVASLYGRSNLIDIVKRIAHKIFIPLTVGGGIRTLDDMHQLLRAGADKLAINTALFDDISLLKKGAATYGSQCMVVYIEAKKNQVGEYECMHTNARENSGISVKEWVLKVADTGAGEILLTFVDTEGTGESVDQEFVSIITQMVDIPVIVNGGFGQKDHVLDAVCHGADAVAAASIFHYHELEKMRDRSSDEAEGNRAFIDLTRSGSARFLIEKIQALGVSQLKHYLLKNQVDCRQKDEKRFNNVKCKTKSAKKVTVVDYGMGNIFSLVRALKAVGADPRVTSDGKEIKEADSIILPGVGAFHRAMANLNNLELIGPLRAHAKKGNPILGICLGMQLLFSQSAEITLSKGLNILDGNIEKLFEKLSGCEKLPHIGWNRLTPSELAEGKNGWDKTIFHFIDSEAFVYFVHSYGLCDVSHPFALSLTSYGGSSFCSAVQKENVSGCQFHPELSGINGLYILKQFLSSY